MTGRDGSIFYFSGVQACTHTLYLLARLLLSKSDNKTPISFVAYDINSLSHLLSDCAVNRFFLGLYSQMETLQICPPILHFPSIFFPFTSPPPLQSVCFLPLACLYVNLTKFTHFPWKSSRIWIHMNCIKKRIQMDCDSKGLYAATGIRINSFWCSVRQDSLAAGTAEPIRRKSTKPGCPKPFRRMMTSISDQCKASQ